MVKKVKKIMSLFSRDKDIIFKDKELILEEDDRVTAKITSLKWYMTLISIIVGLSLIGEMLFISWQILASPEFFTVGIFLMISNISLLLSVLLAYLIEIRG